LVLDSNINDEKLNKIIEICRLKSIIDKDNLGLNQLIEENGFNLSGGERQRIVLARTLLSNFDILIIDEGLSQVDIDLEKDILNDMMNCFKDKTIIVISHRTNNKELYQKIIHLKNGELKYE
jgi:ABC-type transport system involved in cytochrome bd biosynthesis fused ATPase/permease subunit